MLNPYFTQRNEIPGQSGIRWNNVQGYSSFGLDVAGTFTAGSFTLEGTNDNITWTPCKVSNGTVTVDTGIISATGHYTVLTVGFNIVRLEPSTSPALNADLTLSALGTVEVPNMES